MSDQWSPDDDSLIAAAQKARAEVPAVYCEARKAFFRQSKDGYVVSFVVHPNEMPDSLATAPLGQRYMLALAMIGDDEQPASPTDGISAVKERPVACALSSRGSGASHYKKSPPMEQARVRAALLPKDPAFQSWIVMQHKMEDDAAWLPSEHNATMLLRNRCCDGESRSRIATDDYCYQRFLALETDYRIAVGLLPEPR